MRKTSTFTLSIAGVSCEFRGNDPAFMDGLRQSVNVYVDNSLPQVSFELVAGNATFTGPVPEIVETKGRASDTLEAEGPSMRLTMDRNTRQGTLSIVPDPRAFNTALRVIYSFLLASESGFLIHAAAVESHGRAHLFFGPSGAGKTTMTRLSQREGKRILTDEMAAVRFDGRRWLVYGTPFWGEFQGISVADAVELAGMFRLVKAGHLGISPAGAPEMLTALMQTVVSFGNQEHTTQQLLDMVSEILGSVPALNIEFGKTDNPWSLSWFQQGRTAAHA